ncbi:MAG: dehydrogenase [Legionellales bacterium RIFCSPHIGHO2_12_FULL_37_14]|nr:MAG: dehydrogenase [Legionellales bacterium RIFCSPHIGHO2_12_FULL_37_14]
MHSFDFVIIGSGIVGMAVARSIKQRMPNATVAVLEKEPHYGLHASGRNSGVLHCGIYYGSDTLKAKVCSQGAFRMLEFAEEYAIPYAKSGKLILATQSDQLATIDSLMNNARLNGIKAERVNQQEIKSIEPKVVDSPLGIFCPDTAVIDSLAVLKQLNLLLQKAGVQFFFNCAAKGLKLTSKNTLLTTQGNFAYGYLYNCAGAHADTIARWFGLAADYALIPFKGIYWKLSSAANHLVRASIYPVPNIALPFLGVHLTRGINGEVYVGPTAIPVLGRENYHMHEGIQFFEALKIGARLALMYLSNQNNFRLLANMELAKYRKNAFLAAAQKLVPALQKDDLIPSPKVGIRPQLVDLKTKKLEMDYIIETTKHSTHVLNAISPAFTSSFAFADLIINKSGII